MMDNIHGCEQMRWRADDMTYVDGQSQRRVRT